MILRFQSKFFRLVLLAFVIAIGALIFLEIGSRTAHCSNTKNFVCPGSSYNIMAPVPQVPPEIIAIRQKRAAGITVSQEEYRAAFEKAVKELNPSVMTGYNGFSCGDIAYVRNDLPGEAMLHVKRHELEHLVAPEESEFQVNIIAFRAYPLGGAETIGFTLKNLLPLILQKPTTIFCLWRTFKLYFLP